MKNQHQIKIKGSVSKSLLLKIGAAYFGKARQSDVYLLNKKMWRIREESGKFILAKKNYTSDKGGYATASVTSQSIITEGEANKLRKKYGVLVSVNKNRDVYNLGETVIMLDEVEHLGEFVEIISSEKYEITRALKKLKLNKRKIIHQSYIELVLVKNMPNWLKKLIIFHGKVGELAFGITSGVLTTVGLLAGVNSATSSRLAVVASVMVIAVADSFSDAFGMYMSKITERGISRAIAIKYTLGTMFGKVFLPITFIIPLLILPLKVGVVVDEVWGAVALSLLTAEQAIVAGKSIFKPVITNLVLAVVIIICSILAGDLAAKIK